MDQKEFDKLVDKKKYQIFLFKSFLPLPLSFAVHTWFVINKKGKIDRWEINNPISYKAEERWNYLHLNMLRPLVGVNVFPYRKQPRFRCKLIGCIEGKTGSLADDMIKFIEESPNIYNNKKFYVMYPGPNSNTFVQWALHKFPDSGLKLPWNAFGKNYKGIKRELFIS